MMVIDVLGLAEPRIRPVDEPMIYADDLAAVRGDGVFETLMLRGGTVHNLERHARRFERSAAMLDLPAPDLERWVEATQLAAKTFTEADEAALRWVYSRGRESSTVPTGWITVAPVGAKVLNARANGVRVMTAERGFSLDVSNDSPWALIGAKTLSYAANMAALRTAAARGFDDVIFVIGTGDEARVLEGPTSSVIAVRGNRILTPPADEGILAGTSQASLFSLAEESGWEVGYSPLTVGDLRAADGVWLLSSVRIQARVTAIDGRDMPRPEQADRIEELARSAVAGS